MIAYLVITYNNIFFNFFMLYNLKIKKTLIIFKKLKKKELDVEI